MNDDGLSRLAAYGTLRTGERNRNQLAGIPDGVPGVIPGRIVRLVPYPLFIPEPWETNAPLVPVELFEDSRLRTMWDRLDAFEGEEYRRVTIRVRIADGTERLAQVYIKAS